MDRKWHYHVFPLHSILSTHCSYLNIYISQKIRLCVLDLEGQFQTTLPAKAINFLIWKFRSIILIFLLFFCRSCQIQCFLHTWCYSKELKYLNCNLTQTCDSNYFGNSINSVQKALDLTTPAKNRRKFQIKKLIGLAGRVVWNWPSKSTTQSLIFREV